MEKFDFFYSSYYLGEKFTNSLCITQDITPISKGSFSNNWLDPKGQLWVAHYCGTHNIVPDHEKRTVEFIPTGKNGRFSPQEITGSIKIFPENEMVDDEECDIENFPVLTLEFVGGRLKNFKMLN